MAMITTDSAKMDSKSSEGTAKMEDLIKDGFRTFVQATKAANDLPKNRDYDFYNTIPSFSNSLSIESDRVLQLINRILNDNEIGGNIKSTSLACKEELMEEANDAILDRAVAAIDELNGLKSLPAAPVVQTVSANISFNGSWNKINKISVGSQQNEVTKQYSINLLTAKNIVRPQTYFKDNVENGNTSPWKPKITEKPNSLKPLALYLEPNEENEGFEEWSHPYEFELEHFNVPQMFIANVDKVLPVKKVEETPLYEVNTEKQLDDMLEVLRKQKEIAVDLEHHSYRTFLGITCLMQISTRDADYLVDTLELRDKLFILNEVFTKPCILKIFHGASMDIQWLQRDLGLYVVNLFDTHQAAKTLGFSGLSLAYLLSRYCSFVPNKKFQLADWRIRPLLEELKEYAREDTHYLIYVYEMMKKELYKRSNGKDNLIKAVFQASTEVCKIRYIKPRWTPDAHLNLYRRRKKMFDNRQMFALKEIYKWRDTVAREEDESTGYVLPNHMMLQICELLPREVQGILACCNPVPPLIRAHSLELHHIILKAREQPVEMPIFKETNRDTVSKEVVKLNIDSPLHCPHDLTKLEHNDNLPTLLNSTPMKDSNENLYLEQIRSSCKIFNDVAEEAVIIVKWPKFTFLGPFERYKMVKPFLQAKAEQELQKKEEENNSEDDPSVKDRIAALQEHIANVQESMKSNPGASDEKTGETSAVQSRNDFAAPLQAVMSLDTSTPLINMPGSTKRKRDEPQSSNDDAVKPKGKRKNKQYKSNQHHRANSVDRALVGNDDSMYDPKRRKIDSVNRFCPVVINNDDSDDHQAVRNRGKRGRDSGHFQNYSNDLRQNWNRHASRGKKNRCGGGNERDNPQETRENRESGQFYDYSRVDFSQFSGGGKSVGHKQIQSKHKAKNQKRGGHRRGGREQTRSMNFQPSRGKSSFRGRK